MKLDLRMVSLKFLAWRLRAWGIKDGRGILTPEKLRQHGGISVGFLSSGLFSGTSDGTDIPVARGVVTIPDNFIFKFSAACPVAVVLLLDCYEIC